MQGKNKPFQKLPPSKTARESEKNQEDTGVTQFGNAVDKAWLTKTEKTGQMSNTSREKF